MLTAPEIEKASLGYVNSGVLRQWIVKGYIEAGPKAKRAGGPRTFTHREGVKAALIAEFRRCGISLETAASAAELISQTADERFKRHQAGDPTDPAEGIYYILINVQRDEVIPITLRDARRPFGDLVPALDSFMVLNYLKIWKRVAQANVEEEKARKARKARVNV